MKDEGELTGVKAVESVVLEKHNTMVAMPGTIQGHSGWYNYGDAGAQSM